MVHTFLRSLFTLLLFAAVPSFAHEVRPAYLQITEQRPGHFDVLWKQPTMGDVGVRLVPHISNGWLEREPDQIEATPSFLIKVWKDVGSDRSLVGESIEIEGLTQTITDAFVNVTLANGEHLQAILKPKSPHLALQFKRTALPVYDYLALGIEHILTGFDHLLFVLGLLLLVQQRWRLFKTITAFTIAHSITLASTSLGWITVQPSLIEALVALSIVFLAVELANFYRGHIGFTARYPWVIAFTFGLLHGFAFAGALAAVGLPANDIPLSLLLFNVGVEIGQLIFVATALGFIALLRKLPRRLPTWSRWLPPYAIGTSAMFWLLQRLAIL